VLLFTLVLNWVNIPYNDEWGLSQVFDRFYSHGLSLDFLFSQHNEHRMFIPRLVLIASGILTHWDLRFQMLLTVLIVILIFMNFNTYLKKVEALSFRSRIFVMTFINLVLFSLIQSENWFFGLQFVFYIPPLMITTALAGNCSSISFSGKIQRAAALSLISSLTISFGMIAWFLSFPYNDVIRKLFIERKSLPGRSIWHSALYGAAALLTVTLYFYHYQKPSNHPPLSFALHNPIEALAYFLIWCGAPLIPSPKLTLVMAILAGVMILATFSGALYNIFSRLIKRDEQVMQLYPWCVMGVYSIICGIFTTAGRAGFGFDQAFSSRYIAISSYLLISAAVLSLIPVLLQNHRDMKKLRNILVALTFAFLLLYSAGLCKALKNISTHKKELLEGVAALRLSSACPDNKRFEAICTRKEIILDRFRALSRLHLISVNELNGRRILESLSDFVGTGGEGHGAFEECRLQSDRRLVVRGRVPVSQEALPVTVMLVYTDDTLNSKPFATLLSDERPKRGLVNFSDTIDAVSLPDKSLYISAWVIDEKESRAFQCAGTFRIEKQLK
jgi:hypothetical protein